MDVDEGQTEDQYLGGSLMEDRATEAVNLVKEQAKKAMNASDDRGDGMVWSIHIPTATRTKSAVGSDTVMPKSPAEDTQTAPEGVSTELLLRSTPPQPKCTYVDPRTTSLPLLKATAHIFTLGYPLARKFC